VFLQNQPPPDTFIKHFCKIDSSRCQIHPPHTHKKEKKKKQQENGFEPTIFEKSEHEMASSLCLPSGTELHKSGNNSRDQMHLLPKPGFSGFTPLARVVCFFDPRGHI
jgi:hypothetical protein